MTDDVRQLVEYRLEQAHETLQVGRELLENGHCRDAINRGYYAMFYAALGLLAAKQLGTSKHSGAIALLGEHFIKTGEFPSDVAVHLRRAFDLCQKCDYREFFQPDPEQAKELLDQAGVFLGAARRVWDQMTGKP